MEQGGRGGGGFTVVPDANMRSAIKRLNRRGDKGSPWRRPTLEEKGCPSLEPSFGMWC